MKGKTIREIIKPASGSVNSKRRNSVENTAPRMPTIFIISEEGLKPAFSCHSGNFFRKNIAPPIHRGIWMIKTTTATTALSNVAASSIAIPANNVSIPINHVISKYNQ